MNNALGVYLQDGGSNLLVPKSAGRRFSFHTWQELRST